MATTDIRLKRIENEYQSVRGVQDDILDKVDTFESALLGLTEAVSNNGERIDALTELVHENSKRIDIIDDKLDAIMKHLDVPYKPPVGFVKD